MPRYLRRRTDRAGPSQPLSGRREQSAGHPDHVAIANDGRRCTDVQKRRSGACRGLHERVQANYRSCVSPVYSAAYTSFIFRASVASIPSRSSRRAVIVEVAIFSERHELNFRALIIADEIDGRMDNPSILENASIADAMFLALTE